MATRLRGARGGGRNSGGSEAGGVAAATAAIAVAESSCTDTAPGASAAKPDCANVRWDLRFRSTSSSSITGNPSSLCFFFLSWRGGGFTGLSVTKWRLTAASTSPPARLSSATHAARPSPVNPSRIATLSSQAAASSSSSSSSSAAFACRPPLPVDVAVSGFGFFLFFWGGMATRLSVPRPAREVLMKEPNTLGWRADDVR
mmetsp:Transcript_24671/g.61475  ORF Transcript_24671/g.61475 Transcript_24671/m.61475 type:complete len:201 (+) Transcript_24671:1829-2431(+)